MQISAKEKQPVLFQIKMSQRGTTQSLCIPAIAPQTYYYGIQAAHVLEETTKKIGRNPYLSRIITPE